MHRRSLVRGASVRPGECIGVIWGMMERKMEATIVYRGYMGGSTEVCLTNPLSELITN